MWFCSFLLFYSLFTFVYIRPGELTVVLKGLSQRKNKISDSHMAKWMTSQWTRQNWKFEDLKPHMESPRTLYSIHHAWTLAIFGTTLFNKNPECDQAGVKPYNCNANLNLLGPSCSVPVQRMRVCNLLFSHFPKVCEGWRTCPTQQPVRCTEQPEAG